MPVLALPLPPPVLVVEPMPVAAAVAEKEAEVAGDDAVALLGGAASPAAVDALVDLLLLPGEAAEPVWGVGAGDGFLFLD